MTAPMPRELIRLQEEMRLLKMQRREERRDLTLVTKSRDLAKTSLAVERAMTRELRRQLNERDRRIGALIGAPFRTKWGAE